AKLMTEVVTTAAPITTAAQVPKTSAQRKRKGVVIQDSEETTLASVIVHTEDEAFARQLEAELNRNNNWNEVIEQVKRKEREDNEVMRVKSSVDTVVDDQEDASKQGRKIDELDADEDVTLVDMDAEVEMDTNIQGRIAEKKVIITKDTIRQNLRLDDADGIDCLPDEEIFAELAQMGYEKPIGKGFLGVETPLFDNMLVPQQVQDDADVEDDDDVNEVSAASTPPLPTPATTSPPPQQEPIPSPPQAQSAQPTSPP
nr:hypothetical protein [Tanacetum cinerariifolium]